MKIKKILICFALCVLLFATKVYAQDSTDFDIPQDWQNIFNSAPISSDEWNSMSFSQLFDSFFKTIVNKVQEPLRLFMRIGAVLIFASISRGLCPANSKSSIGSILDTVVTLAVFTLCAVPILGLIENMINALETNKNYLSAFVPVFASVLASCGQIGSAAVYSGFFFTTVMLISNFLCHWALPAIRIFFALSIMDGVCDVLDFSKITAIFTKIAKWLLMICATIFVSVISLQGALADAGDSLAMKTGKMILSASVPIIGRAVSDAMSSVYAGLKLLKGSAGIAMIGVLAVSFIPLLVEGAIYYLMLNISSMIADATGNSSSAKMFSGLSEGVSLSMLFVFFFCLMTILSTVMMILVGGGI